MSLFRHLVSKPIAKQLPSLRGSNITTNITPFRTYWQEVIRVTPDPRRPGKQTYEDPEMAANRSARAQNAEGLLRRQSKYLQYEKPWMKRKRLKAQRVYRAKERTVSELKAYVKFLQDAGKTNS
mmetsp:Transcript_9110/g.10644  ORF Transcript_9110/g.10644 Transcript_9110/m.10644 type:complete len:124 (-) Transcript_9110:407-778(-)|eukprot:CAMPEP_0198255176 /NCGR_PEP_ID=MMETSP1447-20131203/5361_1 /TAXON_ID=420782 /ORGANISM="Chaetoceros dichaeta, Strain CCMP1751" /LENGTH=123 /DNA_ID=CAMNT_0043941491 /DNA_START=19 /DNA_END=390 /DNA_ORIENTATION=-